MIDVDGRPTAANTAYPPSASAGHVPAGRALERVAGRLNVEI